MLPPGKRVSSPSLDILWIVSLIFSEVTSMPKEVPRTIVSLTIWDVKSRALCSLLALQVSLRHHVQ